MVYQKQYGVEYTSPKSGKRKTEWYACPREATRCHNIYLDSFRAGGADRAPRVVDRRI
jgi:hypothetical protein